LIILQYTKTGNLNLRNFYKIADKKYLKSKNPR